MPRWLVRTIVGLVLLLVVGAGAYYWLIGDGDPPQALPAYDVGIERLRALADELPGDKPSAIRVEKIAAFAFPATASIGGDGWDMQPMGVYSFQIVLPATTIVIDSALPADKAGGMGATIDDDAYARMDLALASAGQIVVTHEHVDHIGGIAAHPSPEVLRPLLRLTPEQVANAGRYGAFSVPSPPLFDGYAAFAYDEAAAIAPASCCARRRDTPGSQFVYVRLADGREVLFIGDVGWTRLYRDRQGRPRLLSDLMLGEDRIAVFAELAALRAARGRARPRPRPRPRSRRHRRPPRRRHAHPGFEL